MARLSDDSVTPSGGTSVAQLGFTPTTDGVSMILTYQTPSTWGISATTGCPYFDSTAATSGDEAVFTLGSDGSVALVQI